MKRYYLVNVEETNLDFISESDENFINESITQGLVYENATEFEKAFNLEKINTSTCQLRIIDTLKDLDKTKSLSKDILEEIADEKKVKADAKEHNLAVKRKRLEFLNELLKEFKSKITDDLGLKPYIPKDTYFFKDYIRLNHPSKYSRQRIEIWAESLFKTTTTFKNTTYIPKTTYRVYDDKGDYIQYDFKSIDELYVRCRKVLKEYYLCSIKD